MSDTETSAELLLLAMNAWKSNPHLEQTSWASVMGHIRLEASAAGVDADGRLVLVVPHHCQVDVFPVLERGAKRLATRLGITLTAATAARPMPPLPDQDDETLDQLLDTYTDADPELLDRRRTAHGSLTFEIPAHDRLPDYAHLVEAIEQGMWSITGDIDDAQNAGN